MAAEPRGQAIEVVDWLERMGIAFLPYQERLCTAILLTQMEQTPARVIPRSWHEAWLENVAPGRFSDVPDLTTGRWPTACDDRHVWTLATVQGTREVTTVCTRRAHHTGRHAAGAFGRTIAVWEYPR